MTGPNDTPVPASQQSRGPTITVDGLLGELLAAAWYQGVLTARVTVSGWERWKSRGHGLELFRDPTDGSWSLIAVNHPWTDPPTITATRQKGAVTLPYTTHGWWFGHDAPAEPGPQLVARCGGPHVCPDCALEAHRAESETPTVTAPLGERRPYVGARVLYVESHMPGGPVVPVDRAAIVTEVAPEPDTDRVGLCVLNPLGLIQKPLVHNGVERHDGDIGVDHTGEEIPARSYRGGTWHWPATP